VLTRLKSKPVTAMTTPAIAIFRFLTMPPSSLKEQYR
jgi:hypothetical protein